jgi:prevent-host-death family protein
VASVTIRDLRNHGGDVVERVVDRGEPVVITKSGTPVAELRPLPPPGLTAAALLVRWRRLPPVDPNAFRLDVDRLIDARL